jgi:hypothetical protein
VLPFSHVFSAPGHTRANGNSNDFLLLFFLIFFYFYPNRPNMQTHLSVILGVFVQGGVYPAILPIRERRQSI